MKNDKVFGGVCSGLANYFGIDVVVMRIIFVILAVSFGFGLIPYLILWVWYPARPPKKLAGCERNYTVMETIRSLQVFAAVSATILELMPGYPG